MPSLSSGTERSAKWLRWSFGLDVCALVGVAPLGMWRSKAQPSGFIVAHRYDGGVASVAQASAATLVVRFARPMRRADTERAFRLFRRGEPALPVPCFLRWHDARTLVLGEFDWDMAESALAVDTEYEWWFTEARDVDGRFLSSEPMRFRTAKRRVHSAEEALITAKARMVLSPSAKVRARQGVASGYWLIVDARHDACLSADVLPDGTVLPWTWRSIPWDSEIRVLVVRDSSTAERLSPEEWERLLMRQSAWIDRYASSRQCPPASLHVETRELHGHAWASGMTPDGHREAVLALLSESEEWDVVTILRPSVDGPAPCLSGEGVIECSLADVRWSGYWTGDGLGEALADTIFGHELLHQFGWQHHWTNGECGSVRDAWDCQAALVCELLGVE